MKISSMEEKCQTEIRRKPTSKEVTMVNGEEILNKFVYH